MQPLFCLSKKSLNLGKRGKKYEGKLREKAGKGGKGGRLRGPESQLFEVQGSKFKPHPGRDPGQTSAVGVTHGMLVFGIGKDAFNSLFAQSVDVFAALRLA